MIKKNIIKWRETMEEKVPESFSCRGIYYLTIDDFIVYIGQSNNIKRRIVEHISGVVSVKNQEKKYIYLRAARRRGKHIIFHLLERCDGCTEEELNQKEREYIEFFKPPLNTMYNKGVDVQDFYSNINL